MPTPAKKAKPQPAALAAIVDEIGDLDAELAPFKQRIARLDMLRKAVRSHYEPCPADGAFTAEGMRYAILVGERGWNSTINNAQLLKLIGVKVFVSIASFTQKAIEAECDAGVLPAVVMQEQTGPRSLKILAKGKPA